MSGKNKTINQVEDELTAALHDCNLDSMVSVDEIERWMQKLDFEDKLTPIKMLTGLLEDHIVEQYILVEKLVNATITINHVLPLPSLDGKTFKKVLKKRKEQNTPTHLHNIQTSIPPRGWFKIYHKALQLMDQKQFIEARKKFDETFRKLLESKTSEREIYRVFGNAGVAYLFSGEPYIGINCFTIATDLNPNYTFATEQLQKVEKGDYNKFIELGLLGKMTNKMEKWDHRPDYLKLDRLMNWPEKKILKKLSSLGITIDKDEFVHMAQTVNKPEDIAEKLFYPKVSDYTEDEDFFWIAACALWNKYCPDEQSLTGFRNTISKAYEYLSNKNLSLSAINH